MDSSYRLKIDSFLMYSESLRVQNLYTENRRATTWLQNFFTPQFERPLHHCVIQR